MELDDDAYLPEAHPTFAAHFTDELYEDPADDFAPFGSDEAADEIFGWMTHVEDVTATSTVRQLVAISYDEEDEASLEADWASDDDTLDMITIALGFFLIRVTGQIDDIGRQDVLAALARQQDRYGEQPQFTIMTRDLTSFA